MPMTCLLIVSGTLVLLAIAVWDAWIQHRRALEYKHNMLAAHGEIANLRKQLYRK